MELILSVFQGVLILIDDFKDKNVK